MKYLLASVALGCMVSAALAENPTVTFGLVADMPSLRDAKAKDLFSVSIVDAQVKTTLKLTCLSGSHGFIIRKDESCAIAGNGYVFFPGNVEKPRVKYSGGFIVKSDGFTDGRTITANYLSVGGVPASTDTFNGSMILKPESPSAGALSFGEGIIAGLKKKAGLDGGNDIIDDRTDTVEFSNFSTPSGGLPSDKGCAWRGSEVYAYQTSAWFLKLEGDCGGKKYTLTGNMPWVDTEDGNARYDLTLTLPSKNVSSDAALFADATNNDALFATADGISGTITMKLGSNVTVQVDGKPEDVPSSIDATGTLTGQNVPVEVVRSLAVVLAVLSRTFFGS